jgi:CheY-like chemotaxis protein
MPRLLVVDDDPDIRAMFGLTLRSLGDVEEAAGGQQALRLLYAQEYDVILLDLHMPVIGGFSILETLTSKPGPNRDTPIFLITADVSDQARVQALRRHAVFLLTKPVHIGTLLSLVRSSLEKRASKSSSSPPKVKRA